MISKSISIMMQGERYSLSHQILNFNDILNKYKTMMNASALSQYLAKAITIMVVGNNDYINNYLMPELYTTSLNYTTQEFGNLLINNYMQKIMVNFLFLIFYMVHINLNSTAYFVFPSPSPYFKSLKLHLNLLYIKLISSMLYCRHYITPD